MAGLAEHRLTVTTVIECDGAEALLRQVLQLMEPRARRQRDTVRQHDRRVVALAVLDDVYRAPVVRIEATVHVHRGIERPSGPAVGRAPHPLRGGSLRDVRRARQAAQRTRGNARPLHDAHGAQDRSPSV